MTKTETEMYQKLREITDDADRLLALICLDSARWLANPVIEHTSQVELLIERAQQWLARRGSYSALSQKVETETNMNEQLPIVSPDGWIAARGRLPDAWMQRILIWHPAERRAVFAYFRDGDFVNEDTPPTIIANVEHWRPEPAAPQGISNEYPAAYPQSDWEPTQIDGYWIKR